MAQVHLRGVKKTYDNKVDVIHGIDMEIADGEFIVIVGPSGCGKSTLLRMVAGLEEISGGEISIGGRVVNDVEPADRDIAMVFQNYALYPHMSVYDNMAYGLKIAKLPRDQIKARVDKAAAILELASLLERKPRQLSGGQRQRVAMGRAIVRKPAAFLFDEPLSNLDAKLRVQMRVEIRRLQRSLATTSVYVTHDQMEAMTLADRLVVLNAGRIEQMGTPIELYENPATTFVATFIGSPSMNLLNPGTATANGSSGWSVMESTALPQGAATLGIRPEDITLASDAPTDAAFTGTVQVDAVELVGAESYVHGSFADGTTIVFRVHGRSQLRIGETLKIAAQAKDFHLFDSAGKRI
jgi:sn-glycerol 3-phosphate transport system ATP-binding protein